MAFSYLLVLLRPYIDKGQVSNILYKKCQAKDVEMDVRSLEDRRGDFASSWTNSLRHQFKTLPDFDAVFYEVKRQIPCFQ